MDIGGLRVRITIQENETVIDEIGNHTSEWSDYFTCWATVSASGKSAEEEQIAGTTQEADHLDFTVRYCSETASVNSKQHRILLNNRIYNITGCDEMNFKHKCRKFHTELKER